MRQRAHHRRRARRAPTAALILLATGSACAGEPEGGAAPDSATVEAAADSATAPALPAPAERPSLTFPVDSTDWTVGTLEAPSTIGAGPPPVPVLTALRSGVHADYERVTFELAGAGGLPGYRIEYVDRPLYDCGSGEPTYPVGDAWLEIRMEPAAAHTEEGRPTLGARDLPVGQPLLQRIYRTCNFEAVVVHVLALSRPSSFRVMRLADPPRIVMDVRR